MAAPTDMWAGGLSMQLVVASLEVLGTALVIGGLVAAFGWAGVAIVAGALLLIVAIGVERRMGVE